MTTNEIRKSSDLSTMGNDGEKSANALPAIVSALFAASETVSKSAIVTTAATAIARLRKNSARLSFVGVASQTMMSASCSTVNKPIVATRKMTQPIVFVSTPDCICVNVAWTMDCTAVAVAGPAAEPM